MEECIKVKGLQYTHLTVYDGAGDSVHCIFCQKKWETRDLAVQEIKESKMATWEEYLQSKQKLVDIQFLASKQPTPAARLVFYHSASFEAWRVQAETVRKLDEIFENNDWPAISEFTYHFNYLIAAVAKEMRDEIAIRLAVKEGKLEAEKYRPAWWV
jgi:hypothetical protein